jgi:hypothetical protein
MKSINRANFCTRFAFDACVINNRNHFKLLSSYLKINPNLTGLLFKASILWQRVAYKFALTYIKGKSKE